MNIGGIREDSASAKEQSWVETESRLALGNGVSVSDTGEGGRAGCVNLG
jgi:hypothetical protein